MRSAADAAGTGRHARTALGALPHESSLCERRGSGRGVPPAGRAGEGVCVTQVAGAVLALLSGGESAVVGPIAHRGLARASPLVLHFGVFISILRACANSSVWRSRISECTSKTLQHRLAVIPGGRRDVIHDEFPGCRAPDLARPLPLCAAHHPPNHSSSLGPLYSRTHFSASGELRRS